jgi:anti-sigma regulatory factor (Ser/Thr protein kinase)
MLEAADRALRTDIPDSFATAFVGVIDPIAETISYKSAGHPAALLERPDGSIEELRFGGLPLGIRDADRQPPSVLALAVGSVLHLYTDGLTESTRDMLAGEQRLRSAVAATHGSDPAQRAAAIHGAVLVDGSHDDVAILTVTLVPRCDRMRWVFDARDRAGTMRVRDDVLTRLDLAQRAPALHHAAELILAEVVGNLARYAPREVEAVLERDDGRHVLHVRDNGPGFEFLPKLPPDLYSESGRGLFLISALAADFNVTRRPGKGSHMRVVFAT